MHTPNDQQSGRATTRPAAPRTGPPAGLRASPPAGGERRPPAGPGSPPAGGGAAGRTDGQAAAGRTDGQAPAGRSDGQAAAPSLRRVPVQQRSADRLVRILDACAEVLAETGYEDLTTRAVAARAGVPIGSVYRFFSNKRALADALAHRNLDDYIARVADGVAAAERPVDWCRAIDVVVDVYITMKLDVPGFALLDFSVPAPAGGGQPDRDGTGLGDHHGAGQGAGHGAHHGAGHGAHHGAGHGAHHGVGKGAGHGAHHDANHLVAQRLCLLLAEPLGRTPDAGLQRAFLVGVEAADALLQLAFRTVPTGDPAIIAETKELLRAYFARVLG